MTGMFSSAVILCPQLGHAERGCARVYFVVSGISLPCNSRQLLCHSRSIILGNLCITTFKKLPTIKPNTMDRLIKTVLFCCNKFEISENPLNINIPKVKIHTANCKLIA